MARSKNLGSSAVLFARDVRWCWGQLPVHSSGCWLVQPYSMTCCGILLYLPVRLTTPTNVSFWTVRAVGAVVYCVREVVFLLPTLFSLSDVNQVDGQQKRAGLFPPFSMLSVTSRPRFSRCRL